MKVLIGYPAGDEHLAMIGQAMGEASLLVAIGPAISEALPDTDVFIGHVKSAVDWSEVIRRGRLRWIQSTAAGLDHCLTPEVRDSPILVSSASGLFADSVAEQTMALLLGVLRGLPAFVRDTLSGRWQRRPTDQLHGRRVGIVGLGGNGRRIAEVLQPWHVELAATDVYPSDKPATVRYLWGAERLNELMRFSEILILTPPLTPQTEMMIGRDQLESLPPRSVLVNVSRGRVVDEEALVAALRSGRLAGAGLDVTWTEPLPAESPLRQLENVIITPHVGAQSSQRLHVVTELVCENMRRFREGRRLVNQVDKEIGFPHPEDHWRCWQRDN